MRVSYLNERPYCFEVDKGSKDIMPDLVTYFDGLGFAGATMEFLKIISKTLNFTVKLVKPSLQVSGIYDPEEKVLFHNSSLAQTKYLF